MTINQEVPAYLPFGDLPAEAITHYSHQLNAAWQACGSPEGLTIADLFEGAILLGINSPALLVNAAKAIVLHRSKDTSNADTQAE